MKRSPSSPTSATAAQILQELKSLGRESYKRVLMKNHGACEPIDGVPISELKKILKRVGPNYELALELYDTGHYDARYLAGLMADDVRMTERDLQHWVNTAQGRSQLGCTLPWVAASSPHGLTLARRWIDSASADEQEAGWATWSSLVSVKPDADLDLPELKRLMKRVLRDLCKAPDRVRYQMNGFLIAAGCYVAELTPLALEIADELGPVEADLGPNSCEVPLASAYIRNVQKRGTIGRKRKSAKC
ncbi:MAG: DNA alkylation repair protein [Verrucomicrobia bacterium]|nr:DNA alkylation repair protein [Verrucomicrobiota bacterium]